MNPDSVHGCSCYGVFLAAWGRTSEAIPLAEHGVQVSPLAASTHANLGFVLFHARRFDQAVPPLERALELESGNIIARMLLSEVYLRLGRDADGLRVGKGINDSYTAALYAAQKEGAQEAERILDGAVRKGVLPGQYWSAAVAYMRLGDRDRALKDPDEGFRPAERVHPLGAGKPVVRLVSFRPSVRRSGEAAALAELTSMATGIRSAAPAG